MGHFTYFGFQKQKLIYQDTIGKAVKALSPFSNDSQSIVYEPFIDYETGEAKQGPHYFKSLSRTIMQYVEHPEHKFNGDVGVLERKHIHADGVVYIGKEANNIDEQELDVKKAQEFVDMEEIKRNILEMPQKEAERLGVSRSTFQEIKKRMREGKKLNMNTVAINRLL